jgi:hypothetical protein
MAVVDSSTKALKPKGPRPSNDSLYQIYHRLPTKPSAPGNTTVMHVRTKQIIQFANKKRWHTSLAVIMTTSNIEEINMSI